jgi:hypothetical protein
MIELEASGMEALRVSEFHLSKSSYTQYMRQIDRFKSWMRDNNPEYINNNIFLIPFPDNLMINYLGRFITTEDNKSFSKSHVGGFVSAIKWFETNNKEGFTLSNIDHKYLNNTRKNSKRNVASSVLKKRTSDHEGKIDISMEVFKVIVDSTIKSVNSTYQSNTYHCFLVLLWSLSARPDSVANIQFKNMSFASDSLLISFNNSKTDQGGTFLLYITTFVYTLLLYPTTLWYSTM